MIRKDIRPITFNGRRYSHIVIEESAQKHFGDQSQAFFEQVASTLDGQLRRPDEVNDDGYPVHHVASCTSFTIEGKDYDYRESKFKEYPSDETLGFFHGLELEQRQYRELPPKFRKGLHGEGGA